MQKILRRVVYVGLFLVPFIPFLVYSGFFFPFITTKAFAFRAIVEVIFAAWLILALLDAQYRPKRSLILYSVVAFLAVIGLADLLGEAPGKSFWSNFERMEGFVALLHLGAYFVVAASVLREIDWKRWWNTSLAASFVMVIYVLFQLGGVLVINQGGARVDGTLGNASYLAVYMLIHFFVALLFLWRARTGALRSLYGLLALAHLFVVYNTATRGAILGVLGGLLVLALLNVRNREDSRLRKASIATVIAMAVLVGGFWLARNSSFVESSPVLSRFSEISTKELRGGGRAFVWPMAIEGFKDQPILGWGQENFSYVFQGNYDPAMFELEPWFDRAHNIFLDWAIAGGILGLMAYLSLYVALLYMVWKSDFAYGEKTIITSLVAAYFFHNFFVFDHLASYILFFALLAYVHSRGAGELLWTKSISEAAAKRVALPVALVLLIFALYFVNGRPLSANVSLIDALQAIQVGEPRTAVAGFKRAYSSKAALGKPETVEQIVTNIAPVLQGGLPVNEQNEYFQFAKGAAIAMAQERSDDARYQLMAGSFLLKTGFPDEALIYLGRAEELSPGKQAIKFEIAEAYIQKKDYRRALDVAKKTFELEPRYTDAQFTYAVAAIYAGDRALEQELKEVIYAGDAELEKEIRESGQVADVERWTSSDLIIRAYLSVGRYADAVGLLERRIEREPGSPEHYVSLAAVYYEAGDRAQAIVVLRRLAERFPEYKERVEAYIQEIQS